ncbi:MAG: KilA-N domain-containing protein [Aquabacterium sp.]
MTALTLITKTYGTGRASCELVFREDGWFNMTKAAKFFGKRLDHFFVLAETREYTDALKGIPGITGNIVEAQKGFNGGTWAHPKLAVFFARWLDVRFSVWCDTVIEGILRGSISSPPVAQLQGQSWARAIDASLIADAVRGVQAQVALLTETSNKLHAEMAALKERPALSRPSMIQPPSLQAKPKDALMTIDAFFDEVKPEVQAYRRSRFAYSVQRFCLDKRIAHCPASPHMAPAYPKEG